VNRRRELSPAERADLLLAPFQTHLTTAQILGCGETGLRSAMARGEIELPVISIGARRIIPTRAILNLLGENPDWEVDGSSSRPSVALGRAEEDVVPKFVEVEWWSPS